MSAVQHTIKLLNFERCQTACSHRAAALCDGVGSLGDISGPTPPCTHAPSGLAHCPDPSKSMSPGPTIDNLIIPTRLVVLWFSMDRGYA